LIAFYLLIELQALSFYVLTAFKRDSSYCAEAGLKYFIVGSLMSGAFLMGVSLIYGSLGTTNLNALFLLLIPGNEEVFLMFNFCDFRLIYSLGIFLVTFTILFKIACAPFHFWVPDVYEGAPLSSTILFSIVPKVGMLFFLLRWVSCVCVSDFAGVELVNTLLFCGLLSCFVGVFFAFSQKRVKRLLIYSTIGQIGFIVSAVSVNTLQGHVSVLFFLFVYIITSIIIWGHISFFTSFKSDVSSFFGRESSSLFITDIADIVKKNFLWGFSLILVFFSIAGIPPLVGFSSKIFILLELINYSPIAVTFLLILSSISAYYYIRIVKLSFFEFSVKNSLAKKRSVIVFSSDLDVLLVCFSFCFLFLIIGFFSPEFALLLCERTLLMTTGI
jgi:NADH-quinone oxidoreductase subunit N